MELLWSSIRVFSEKAFLWTLLVCLLIFNFISLNFLPWKFAKHREAATFKKSIRFHNFLLIIKFARFSCFHLFSLPWPRFNDWFRCIVIRDEKGISFFSGKNKSIKVPKSKVIDFLWWQLFSLKENCKKVATDVSFYEYFSMTCSNSPFHSVKGSFGLLLQLRYYSYFLFNYGVINIFLSFQIVQWPCPSRASRPPQWPFPLGRALQGWLREIGLGRGPGVLPRRRQEDRRRLWTKAFPGTWCYRINRAQTSRFFPYFLLEEWEFCLKKIPVMAHKENDFIFERKFCKERCYGQDEHISMILMLLNEWSQEFIIPRLEALTCLQLMRGWTPLPFSDHGCL